MMNILLPTIERVRELLSYNPETGIVSWKVARGGRVGDPAGTNYHGYTKIFIDGRRYYAHRVAWLLHYGEWPKADIDHINGRRSDNRIANLRDVPRSINMQNQRSASASCKSGFLGVVSRGNGWIAQISLGGKTRKLGTFDTPEAAHSEYLSAKRQLHAGCTI